MMIGQQLTTIPPESMATGGNYVTVTNPEGTTLTFGQNVNTSTNNQQRMVANSVAHADVNNNEVITCTSGMRNILH